MRHLITAFVILLCPGVTLAQSVSISDASSGEPATIGFVTGLAVGSGEVGPLAGGTLSAGVTSWLSLEGTAGFADRGPGVNGVYAVASAVFNMRPFSAQVVPFATVGGGLYHAKFDMANREMFGELAMPSDAMIEFVGGYATWLRMYETQGAPRVPLPLPRQIPGFYADRIGRLTRAASGTWGRRAFTDPATSLGGGAVIRLSDKVVLRPDARALFVFNEGDTHVVGLVNLGIGFRF